MALSLSIIPLGCGEPPQKLTLEQQIAKQVDPLREELKTEATRSRSAEQERAAEAKKLLEQVSQLEKATADLGKQLKSAQDLLAGYEDMNARGMLDSIAKLRKDLEQQEQKHKDYVAEMAKVTEDAAKDRRSLHDEDKVLRAHTDKSVADLDAKSTEARRVLRAELITRFEEDRNVVLSSFRQLEDQVAAATARIALTAQLLRETLTLEREAVAGRQERLAGILLEMDRQFETQGAQTRDAMAGKLFQDAMSLHQRYINNNNDAAALEDAILSYRKGLSLRPDDAEMHYQLGTLLVQARRAPEAEAHLKYYVHDGKDPEHVKQAKQMLGS